MLDLLAEGLFRVLWAFLGEVVFCKLLYWPGWIILRILTLGRYPPEQTRSHNRYFVGGISLIVALIGVTVYFS